MEYFVSAGLASYFIKDTTYSILFDSEKRALFLFAKSQGSISPSFPIIPICFLYETLSKKNDFFVETTNTLIKLMQMFFAIPDPI